MSDDITVNPPAWPACSECNTAYVLRRAILFTSGTKGKGAEINEGWVWQRDCKHKKAKAVLQRARVKTTRRTR